MTDKPILFSAPMVRALLAGTKTQTRRVAGVPTIEPQGTGYHVYTKGGGAWCVDKVGALVAAADYLPFQPGDRLWVREAWRPSYDAEGWRDDLQRDARPSDFDPATTAIEYLADGTNELGGKGRPGIHMPRWASRLTLAVTAARVERLHEISEDDARAEGAYVAPKTGRVADSYFDMAVMGTYFHTARDWYANLWCRLNGATSWALNPYVAAYTFTVEKKP